MSTSGALMPASSAAAVSSNSKTSTIETAKTSEPTALVLGLRPERSRFQISTGSVVSKRVSRKEMTNSSQEKVIDRKKPAKSAGAMTGTVTSASTFHSGAPRSRAARSMLIWWSPIWL